MHDFRKNLGTLPWLLMDAKDLEEMLHRFAIADCTLGTVLVVTEQQAVCAVLLGASIEEVQRERMRTFTREELIEVDPSQLHVMQDVMDVLDGIALHDVPVSYHGTEFQKRVWDALRTIPVGSTVTYTQLATALGTPNAVRAVASACAANMIAVIVPCHRVIRADGGMADYRWGVHRKAQLLQRESRSLRLSL